MTDRLIDRVRKLLELSKSTNEHEAASAAARAAELMSEHAISAAMLATTSESPAPEAIEEAALYADTPKDAPSKRVAWRESIAAAVARSLDCEIFHSHGPGGVLQLHAIGRASSVATWRYMAAYLFRTVDELADAAWLADGADLAAVGQRPRAWKGAFRLGAAHVIATRLREAHHARATREHAQARQLATGNGSENATRALVRVSTALEAVAKDREEVKAAFKRRTSGPGWRSVPAIGTRANSSGYAAGREAGRDVTLDRPKRALGGES
jgi:hypothetical protein